MKRLLLHSQGIVSHLPHALLSILECWKTYRAHKTPVWVVHDGNREGENKGCELSVFKVCSVDKKGGVSKFN